MQKLKKVLLCFFTFLVSLTMFGCAQVKFDTTLTESGAIVSSFTISFDEGSYSHEVNAYKIIREYFHQLNNAYEENLINLYSNVYDFVALDPTEEKTKYDDPQEKFAYILKQNASKFLISDSEEDFVRDTAKHTITINKTFVSIYAYVMYFYPSAFEYNADKNAVVISNSYKSMVDIPIAGEFTQDDSLFIKKYIQTCVPFYYNGEEPKFLKDGSGTYPAATEGMTLAEALSNETGLTVEDVKLMFSFTTPYKRLHSDGEFSENEKGYTHTWTLKDINAKVTFWRKTANYPAWYITAAIIGFLVLTIGFATVKIVLNIKKKKGLKALKQLDELARGKEQNKD